MVFLLASSLLISCSKEEIVSLNIESSLLEQRGQVEQTYTYVDETTDILTELGDIKQNPYSIENLMMAMISLCGDTIGGNIRATDKQVKFSPRDYNEALELFADTSLIILEYNINREVTQRGTYLNRYKKGDKIPAFYSVVPINSNIRNNITYEVLETYSFLVDNPILLAESFRLTGNIDLIHDYIEFSETTMDSISICKNLFPPRPIEECSCGNYILYPQTISENEIIYAWKCPCNDPAVPNCVEPCYLEFRGTNWEATPPAEVWKCICPMLPPGNDGIASINNCGCPTYGSETRPAGCVNVENTLNNVFDGVDEVKVTVEKLFWKPRSTFTNSNGCWRINHSYTGKISVKVNFENGDNYIKNSTFSIPSVSDPVGSSWGPDYRHFETNYALWEDQGSPAQRYWGAATINNGVKEFDSRTSNWVTPVPSNLEIVLRHTVQTGAAPMNSWLFGDAAPDLYIGTNFNQNFTATEDVREVLFHELAHASHFAENGPGWWNIVLAQTLANLQEDQDNPWGNGDEPAAEVLGLAESWAEFISNLLLLRPEVADEFIFGYDGPLDFDGWVPTGLHHDLFDLVEGNSTGITDNIGSIPIRDMFDQLDASTLTFDQYYNNINTILPAGDTQADLEILFEDYNLR